MSSAVNSGIGEVSIVTEFGVSTNLPIDIELLPRLGDRPSEVVDPSAGAIGRNSHIGVAGVLEDSVLSTEVNVDIN
jgi:hypothetical protein